LLLATCLLSFVQATTGIPYKNPNLLVLACLIRFVQATKTGIPFKDQNLLLMLLLAACSDCSNKNNPAPEKLL
jgi:hypothetical protein